VKREAAWKKLWVVVSDEGGRPEEWSERRRKEVINLGEVERVIGGVNCEGVGFSFSFFFKFI
jgi:hypothetical protein